MYELVQGSARLMGALLNADVYKLEKVLNYSDAQQLREDIEALSNRYDNAKRLEMEEKERRGK